MLKIGEFSKLSRVSIKTLRYYDSIGLLSPDEVDDENGYRYYSSSKLVALSEINRLKEVGFSLVEIKRLMSSEINPKELVDSLNGQKLILEDELKEAEMKLLSINEMIVRETEGVPMEEVTIKQLPKVIVGSYRITIPSFKSLFEVAPAMGKVMENQGAVCRDPFYCFNIYHDEEYRESDIDLEVCEAVVAKCEDSEGVVYKEVEEIPEAVCMYHRGNYDTLSKSYGELFQWMEENGYEKIGKIRESFIDGIWNKEDPREWLTEIQIPVRDV